MHDTTMQRTVLHTMRLMGHSPTERLARRLGWPVEVTQQRLRSAQANGWVETRSGAFAGWSLTQTGRTLAEALLAAELDDLGARGAAEAGYGQFLTVNPVFLEICTDWQLRRSATGELITNDHGDVSWDANVLHRLSIVDAVVLEVVDGLARSLNRFASYRPRFVMARAKIEAGEFDWFTKPVIDSYHSVWFELHEDLLGTLGRQRTQER